MSAKLKKLVSQLRGLNEEYYLLGVKMSKVKGQWPFDSPIEVEARKKANELCAGIMRTEREIINELLK